MKKILIILLFLPTLLRAEIIYMSQSGSGSGNGSTTSNRASAAFFNTSGNWGVGAGKISSGDTVSMSGNVTTQLVFQGSGTSGNVITLLFESGATMSNPAWNPGAISTAGNDYLVIDGGTNGIIENTANGSVLANHVASSMIQITDGSNNIIVQNLTIRNGYVRTVAADTEGDVTGVEMVNNISAVRVTNCVINHCYSGIGLSYQIASDLEYDHNTISNCNWGAHAGNRTDSATLTNIRAHHNNISNYANWDYLDTSANHHNGIYFWAETDGPGSLGDVLIYNNTFGPHPGSFSTSHYFTSGRLTGTIKLYNNLFLLDPGEANGNENIVIGLRTSTGTIEIYNNTFIGGGLRGAIAEGPGGAVWTIRNNIFYNWDWCNRMNGTTGTITFNHNLFFQNNSYDGIGTDLSEWQAQGYDLDAIVSNPMFVGSGNYSIQSGSPAKDAGVSLSSTFTDDIIGTSRPQGPAWDIGAYEFIVSADSIAPTPNPMTFSSVPAAVDAFSVAMTASTATDAGGGIMYYFDETSGHAGGTDSGWQSSASYTDSGLSPSTLYTYTVKARDTSLNQTTASSGASATTLASTGGTVNITTLNVTNLRVGP